ncbi:MAG: TonB-dependent receptor [Bacteroidota bacterium]
MVLQETGYSFSQFARIDYDYNEKYLAAITVRRDGSSRFGADNQYGIFPAASVGWRIDKEAFMENSKFFSELKLRAGIGRVGNQQIGDLARFLLFNARYGTSQGDLTPGFWETYMNVGTAYSLSGANTGTLPSGFVQTQAENSALKWETTDEINVGLDFTVFKNKIFGSFDYFSRNTTGILIVPPVASALEKARTKQ